MKMSHKVFSFSLWLVSTALCANVVVTMHSTTSNQAIGKIIFENKAKGLLIIPHLNDLPPGSHGFHLHDKPSCANAGQAAGGHFDPKNTGKHLGPDSTQGHLGDLPVLVVNKRGIANKPMFAPHLRENELKGHAIIIHAGGDNYSDTPKPLGGGGERIACGVISN